MVEGRKIKSVSVVGLACYHIGMVVNGLTIATIEDKGMEWEDGIDFIYHCLDADGKLVVAIENCPVVVEYESN
jgi:hypothetical protein